MFGLAEQHTTLSRSIVRFWFFFFFSFLLNHIFMDVLLLRVRSQGASEGWEVRR